MANIVITGANRGIGLELARSYLREDNRVFAACRQPEKAGDLAKLAESSDGQLSIHPLDVTSSEQREAMTAMLGDTAVDILVNNAGVYPHKGLGFGELDEDDWLRGLHVNTVAPMMMTQALLDNILAGDRRLVASVTSKMGSIADNTSGGSYAYRASKSALNSAMRSLAIDLEKRGVTVILLHPGWVRTDMGGEGGLISTEESVSCLRGVLDRAGPGETGSFFDRDGSIIPW